jgi:hypothetical protein
VKQLVLLVAGLGLTVGLAGCGGSTTYSLNATKQCLLARGAKVGAPLDDFVASTATGGSFKTMLSDNWVTISFGQTLNDGVQLQDAYERFAHENVRSGLPDVLRRYDNVVTLWHRHPQDSDLALVVGCLR